MHRSRRLRGRLSATASADRQTNRQTDKHTGRHLLMVFDGQWPHRTRATRPIRCETVCATLETREQLEVMKDASQPRYLAGVGPRRATHGAS